MIGFITDKPTAQAVLAAIAQAFKDNDSPAYWSPGAFHCYSGPNQGAEFIPASDTVLDTPLSGDPPLTPRESPEFRHIINMLGGLDARKTIDPQDIQSPEEEP